MLEKLQKKEKHNNPNRKGIRIRWHSFGLKMFIWIFIWWGCWTTYQPTTIRTEGNCQKLIRLMSQSVRQTKRKLISQFSNIVDSDLIKDVRNIPVSACYYMVITSLNWSFVISIMLITIIITLITIITGTNMKILYYDK